MSEVKQLLFLVNTPYHLFISYLLTRLANDVNVDILLIESEMIIETSLWNQVFHFNNLKRGSTYNPFILFNNVKKLRKYKKEINNYLKFYKPSRLFTFIDHNPVNSMVISSYRQQVPNGKIVLVEEGIAPYVSFVGSKKGNKVKAFAKKVMGFGNVNTLPIGRVHKFDYAIVSESDLMCSGYAKEAKILTWPKGSFPVKITDEFYNLMKTKPDKLESGGCLILGQPLSEDGLLTLEEEKDFLCFIGKSLKNAGIKPVYKPHPRESKVKMKILHDCGFQYNLDFACIPVEIIFAKKRPSLVLTVFSSAAINYAIRYGGSVLWLEELVFHRESSLLPLLNRLNGNNLIVIKDEKHLNACLSAKYDYRPIEEQGIWETVAYKSIFAEISSYSNKRR